VFPRPDWLPVSAEIVTAADTLVDRLERAGARVEVAAPEGFGDLREHHALYLSFLNCVTSPPLPLEERLRQAEQCRANDHDGWGEARAAALTAGIQDWLGIARREQYRAAYRAFFKDWDVLLAPITLRTAFPHVDVPPPGAEWAPMMLEVDGKQHWYEDQLVYPGLATLSGQPATAFPVGLASDGLPLSLQAIGPYLEDYTAIRFAGLAAREMGGCVPPPGF
jgi:amidase